MWQRRNGMSSPPSLDSMEGKESGPAFVEGLGFSIMRDI